MSYVAFGDYGATVADDPLWIAAPTMALVEWERLSGVRASMVGSHTPPDGSGSGTAYALEQPSPGQFVKPASQTLKEDYDAGRAVLISNDRNYAVSTDNSGVVATLANAALLHKSAEAPNLIYAIGVPFAFFQAALLHGPFFVLAAPQPLLEEARNIVRGTTPTLPQPGQPPPGPPPPSPPPPEPAKLATAGMGPGATAIVVVAVAAGVILLGSVMFGKKRRAA